MLFDKEKKIDEKQKEELKKILSESVDKTEAIIEVADKIVSLQNQDLIKDLHEQENRAAADQEYRKSLNLRNLSNDEKQFYEKFKNLKQAFTADQIDIIPTTIIDKTMDDIKKESNLLKLVNFAPSDVKKWITASHSGIFGWGGLTDKLVEELSTEIKSLNIELAKLHVLIVIPKAVRDLSLPFVDKYFMAVLKEVFHDGLEYGYLCGKKENEPIGIYNKIDSSTDGVHNEKKLETVKGFTPKDLAPVLTTLCKDGKRVIDKLYLVCNPLDRYEYVNPALYGEAMNGAGYVCKSFMEIEVVESTNNPKGKALFTIAGKYTMGNYGMSINEYKETKAIEDVDLLIAKTYANGRADDDSTAVPIDVTKLEEYVPKFLNVAAAPVTE